MTALDGAREGTFQGGSRRAQALQGDSRAASVGGGPAGVRRSAGRTAGIAMPPGGWQGCARLRRLSRRWTGWGTPRMQPCAGSWRPATRLAAGSSSGTANVLAVLIEGLAEARERIAGWPLAGGGFETIEPGLRATYRRGRKGLRGAVRGASATALHEWRKDVKYHRHHLELLVGLGPDVLAGAAGTARRLGDLLGDHHDLHELRVLLSTVARTRAERARA